MRESDSGRADSEKEDTEMVREDLLSVEADLRRLIRDELKKLGVIEPRPAGIPVKIEEGQICDAFSFERMMFRVATGQAFPPNMGKIIGTLDADGNLVQAEDQPTKTPVGARTRACDSTPGNQPPKASDSRRT
jgi:hypothetical protein